MENIILCDCQPKEIYSFREGIESEAGVTFSVKSYVANFLRKSKIANIRRYAMYFLVPIITMAHRKRYQYIIGWQQFYALIFSFYCSLFHLKKKNIVVALNFTYKKKNGIVGKIYKRFMRKCLNPKYMDYIHVPSNDYANLIVEEFAFPQNRIIVSHFGINDEFATHQEMPAPTENFFGGGISLPWVDRTEILIS
jgi:hypothetical protein